MSFRHLCWWDVTFKSVPSLIFVGDTTSQLSSVSLSILLFSSIMISRIKVQEMCNIYILKLGTILSWFIIFCILRDCGFQQCSQSVVNNDSDINTDVEDESSGALISRQVLLSSWETVCSEEHTNWFSSSYV